MINANHVYAIWTLSPDTRVWQTLATYKTESQLRKAWEKNKHITAMQARANVSGVWLDITGMMPPRVLNEYNSAEERDALIIEGASYFQVTRFLGVGQYERHRKATRTEAVSLAEELSQANRANYMVYAITPLERSAFVQSVIYQPRGE